MDELPERPERLLTPAEANDLLPAITPLVQQLQGLHRSLLQANEQLSTVAAKLSEGNGHPIRSLQERLQELTEHQVQLAEAFQSALDQLQAFGGMLKDLQMGLVDFYGERDGEVILLCWRLGEDRVGFWHPLDSGYAGRQPLE